MLERVSRKSSEWLSSQFWPNNSRDIRLLTVWSLAARGYSEQDRSIIDSCQLVSSNRKDSSGTLPDNLPWLLLATSFLIQRGRLFIPLTPRQDQKRQRSTIFDWFKDIKCFQGRPRSEVSKTAAVHVYGPLQYQYSCADALGAVPLVYIVIWFPFRWGNMISRVLKCGVTKAIMERT